MEKQNHKAFRIALAAAFAILLIIALIYFTGVVYFSTHFPFNTYFLGYDISQCRQSAIDEIMQSESDARTLTVLEMDGAQEVIKLSYAVGYRRLVSEPEGGWIPENAGFRWPLSLYETSDLTRTEAITYSEDMVDDAVAALRAMDPANITEPQDARLEWQDDVCVIVPEVDGNELYPDRVENAIRSAIEGDLDFIDLAAEDCYKKADIRSDNEDIVQVYSRYAAINFQKIEIDMTGETITLSPDDVLSFFTGSPAKFILDADAVSEFVQGLKDRYDTYERERPFVNHYGNEITVGTRADTYGFKMDLDATTALLTETLEGHERADKTRVDKRGLGAPRKRLRYRRYLYRGLHRRSVSLGIQQRRAGAEHARRNGKSRKSQHATRRFPHSVYAARRHSCGGGLQLSRQLLDASDLERHRPARRLLAQ